MELVVFLTICSFFLYSITALNTYIRKREYDNTSFSCGSHVFTNTAVRDAVMEALRVNIGRRTPSTRYFPIQYLGPLFDENHEYMIWPLRTDGLIHEKTMDTSSIYLVFDPSRDDLTSAVVGVIARLVDRNFIKCTKIHQKQQQQDSLSSVQPQDNLNTVYNCGHKKFLIGEIEEWLPWIKSSIGNGLKYPALFKEYDYQKNMDYYISPISKGIKPGLKSKWIKGTYFLVVTSTGEFVDLIAKLKIGDYISCRKESLTEDQSQKLPQVPLARRPVSFKESGYLCGRYFFSDSFLKASSKLAKTSSRRKMIKNYLEKYEGLPYNEKNLIMSIFPGMKPHYKGTIANHFLVMNQLYEIISVIVRASEKFEVCNLVERESEIIYLETDSFECEEVIFSFNWLKKTSEIACENLFHGSSLYPVPYYGPDFDVPGPYFTYPLFVDFFYKKRSGKQRIVINSNCQIAGVLEIKVGKKSSEGKFQKCKRRGDSTIPGEAAGRIIEIM